MQNPLILQELPFNQTILELKLDETKEEIDISNTFNQTILELKQSLNSKNYVFKTF